MNTPVSTQIQEFFVVTNTSVYHVKAAGENKATAVKIALRGGPHRSGIPVGFDMAKGGMVAVGKQLQSYFPRTWNDGTSSGCERRLEFLSTNYWKLGTSPIIALFKDEASAMDCFSATNQRPCDYRWIESTRQVVQEIGQDHPSFYVCTHSSLQLID